jgi:hypothetical protein
MVADSKAESDLGLKPRNETPMKAPRTASNERFATLMTAVFTVLVVWVSLHHEPWRDEADAWLAARDMSPVELFHWLGGAGTPGLWYLLLMPLAKLGLPYQSMALLHAGLAIAVAAVIAFFAPFGRLFKALIIFGHYIAYEYAVVARSYVLTALLVFVIAMSLTAGRKRWWVTGMLLGLLFNTNAHGFLLAGIISAGVAIDAIVRRQFSRKLFLGLCIAAVGGALAFLQLLPPQHAQSLNASPHWLVSGDVISQAFFPHVPPYIGAFIRYAHGRMWAAWTMYWGIRIVGLALLLSILFYARRSPMAVAIGMVSAVAIIYVCVFKWYGGERHAGLLFIMLVFVLWISPWPWHEQGFFPRLARGGLAVSLSCSVVAALVWSYLDVRWDYSGGKEAAQFIQAHALDTSPIAAVPAAQSESILPYLPREKFWYVGRKEPGTYIKWDQNWNKDYSLSEPEILARVHDAFPSGNSLLLTASKPLHNPQAAGYRLIFQNSHRQFDENALDEHYYLYAPMSIDNSGPATGTSTQRAQ